MTFWTLFSYLKTHRVAMAVILVLLIGETGISLLIPYLVGQFTGLLAADAAPLVIAGVPLSVDLAADDAWQAGTLWWVLAIWVGLLILQMGLRFQTGFRTNVIGAHVLAHLSCQVYNHIQALPLSYFVTQRKGAVIALLSNDVQVVSFFLTGVLTGLVPALLLVLGVGTMMWILHPQIALVIMICVPLFFILVKILSRAIKPLSEQVVATQAQAVALVSDNVQQIGLVKAFNREAQSSAEFAANAQHLLALRSKMLTIQAFITPFMQLCIALGVLGIVLVSVINLQTAQITIAQMITLLLYGALFAKPMGVFAGLYGQVQQAQGAATRIIGLLNEPIEENTDALPDIDEDRDIEGRVRIQDLSFSYPQGEPLFAQVNFSVVPGQIGVIVGKNGRGKTTLLNLIMRFMEPDSGGISLDNKTIQSYNLTSIRRQFGLVSQDIALAHGTIKDNLMFGVVDHASISSEQLQHVLMITGICGFTDDLPLGIDTHIGENGIRLSGGQRQRIALARALLLATPILLFDEPTSFADNDTQQEFARMMSVSDALIHQALHSFKDAEYKTYNLIDTALLLRKEIVRKEPVELDILFALAKQQRADVALYGLLIKLAAATHDEALTAYLANCKISRLRKFAFKHLSSKQVSSHDVLNKTLRYRLLQLGFHAFVSTKPWSMIKLQFKYLSSKYFIRA